MSVVPNLLSLSLSQLGTMKLRLENIRKSVDKIQRALGPHKKLDLFEPARVDPNIPIEQQVENLATVLKEGKFTHIGLSECNAQTLRRANAVREDLPIVKDLADSRNIVRRGRSIQSQPPKSRSVPGSMERIRRRSLRLPESLASVSLHTRLLVFLSPESPRLTKDFQTQTPRQRRTDRSY